jgi:hypothetical protein
MLTLLITTQVHASLRQVGIHLSRATIQDTQGERIRGITYARSASMMSVAPNAPVLATSLCKVIKGFLRHPLECLSEDASLDSLGLVRDGTFELSMQQPPQSGGSKGGKEKTAKQQQGRLEASALAYLEGGTSGGVAAGGGGGDVDDDSKSTGSSNHSNRKEDTPLIATSASQDAGGNSGSGDHQKEAVAIDRATMCLYQAAVVRHFVLPVLEDRNGALNTYLLRSVMGTRGLDAMMDTFSIAFATLHDALKDQQQRQQQQQEGGGNYNPPGDNNNPQQKEGKKKAVGLGAAGNCAVFAMSSFASLFRKLGTRSAVTQSRVSAALKGVVDEYGTFDVESMGLDVLVQLAKRLAPVVAKDSLAVLPASMHHEWLLLAGELVLTIGSATAATTGVGLGGSSQESSLRGGGSAGSLSGGPPSVPALLRGARIAEVPDNLDEEERAIAIAAIQATNGEGQRDIMSSFSAMRNLTFEQLIEGVAADNSPDGMVARAAERVAGALTTPPSMSAAIAHSSSSSSGPPALPALRSSAAPTATDPNPPSTGRAAALRADSPSDGSSGVQRLEADLMAEAEALGATAAAAAAAGEDDNSDSGEGEDNANAARPDSSPAHGLPPLPPRPPAAAADESSPGVGAMHVDTSYVGPAVGNTGSPNSSERLLLTDSGALPPAPRRQDRAGGNSNDSSGNRDRDRASRRGHGGSRRRGSSKNRSPSEEFDSSDPQATNKLEGPDPAVARMVALWRAAADMSNRMLHAVLLLCDRKEGSASDCSNSCSEYDDLRVSQLMPALCKLVGSFSSEGLGASYVFGSIVLPIYLVL